VRGSTDPLPSSRSPAVPPPPEAGAGGSPRRLLVFGASGHIGGPLARFVQERSPETALRLATSSPGKLGQLERDFPAAEVVLTSYLDPEALAPALAGVEGVFIVTPDFFDEERAMANLAAAVRAAGTVRRAVRIVGLPPATSLEHGPADVDDPGPAMQHLRAVATLRAGGVPLTVLNSAGYFMDDFVIHFAGPLRAKRKLVVPYERRMCFTEPGELGKVAACLLLSDDGERLPGVCHFNSGEDPITFRDVAALLSEVTGVEIAYDPSPQGFLEELGPILTEITGDERAAHRLLTDFRAEQEEEDSFFGSPLGEELLGRPLTTLRQWAEARRHELLPS
jgi:uncharacterized protein YbjT (DUF2867 family)